MLEQDVKTTVVQVWCPATSSEVPALPEDQVCVTNQQPKLQLQEQMENTNTAGSWKHNNVNTEM